MKKQEYHLKDSELATLDTNKNQRSKEEKFSVGLERKIMARQAATARPILIQ